MSLCLKFGGQSIEKLFRCEHSNVTMVCTKTTAQRPPKRGALDPNQIANTGAMRLMAPGTKPKQDQTL